MKKTLEQVEAEALTRRAALGRIGFLAGAAAVAALTSDDLTRLVGRELQKRAGDNKVVEQVAKELQGAGIAIAGNVALCTGCIDIKTSCYSQCLGDYSICVQNNGVNCQSVYDGCKAGCLNSAKTCCQRYDCNCGFNAP